MIVTSFPCRSVFDLTDLTLAQIAVDGCVLPVQVVAVELECGEQTLLGLVVDVNALMESSLGRVHHRGETHLHVT